MRYFIGKDGKQLGPFDAQQVRDQLKAGLIGYDDLVWHEGLAAWASVRTEFPPLPDVPPIPSPGGALASPSPYPPHNPFVTEAGVKGAAEQLVLAGRGRRLRAVIIDSFIVAVACAPGLVWLVASMGNLQQGSDYSTSAEVLTLIAAPLLLVLFPVLALLVYQTWLLSKRGQTIGKRLLGIRIVRMNGVNPGFVHAVLLRSFVMQLLGAIPVAGPVISIVDPLLIFRADRRCLHDLLADTQVVEI